MITVTQKCDVCKTERQLVLKRHGSTRQLIEAAEEGGWREVRENAHLCKDCINGLVK